MFKKIFIAGAALIFLMTSAFALDTCKTLAQVKQSIAQANVSLVYKTDILMTDPIVVKSFTESLFKYTGPGPFKIEDVATVVISVPTDEVMWMDMVGFYDKAGCKIAYIGVPKANLDKIVREAAASNGTES